MHHATRRSPGRPRAGNDPGLRERIVTAATREFAAAGFDGAKVGRIAREAGCDRALVYHYFKTKRLLFQAALDAGAARRVSQMDRQPQSLAEALTYWFGRNLDDPERIRLVMQEALAADATGVSASGRGEYLAMQLQAVKAFQAMGLLRSDMDATHLLTAILALTSFPAAFPDVCKTALGVKSNQELTDKWSRALEQLARVLGPPAAKPSV